MIAAYQKAQRLRDVGDAHPKLSGFLPINRRAQFGLAHDQRCVRVNHAREMSQLIEQVLRILVELLEVGAEQHEGNVGVSAPAAADGRDRGHNRAQAVGLELRQDSLAHAPHNRELGNGPIRQID